MRKRVVLSLLAAATLSLGVFAGCFTQTVSISSIEKTGSVGLVDYYTITYTDGTTSQFTVTNGKDGTDAQNVTAQDVYETYKEIYKDENLTFKEFCEKFLNVSQNSALALNSCLRSCLKVYTVFHEKTYDDYGRYLGIYETSYCGSAVVYRMEEDYTYMLTNYHVIYDADAALGYTKFTEKTWAYLYGSESAPVQDERTGVVSVASDDTYAIECEYIGGAISYDVAVIKAKTEDLLRVNPQVQPVTVNYNYSVGENTFAVGNPDNGGISVTEGVVSVDSDYISLKIDNTVRYYRSIRTDTALTHGSSGGGLFNMQGELIGLNNAGDESITSMNFAIPATALTGVADGIIHYNAASGAKTTKKALIGVTSDSVNSKYVYDEATGGGHIEEDVVITNVTAGSLAEMMGLKKDDIIKSVTLNGKKCEIYRQFQISDLLLNARVGDELKIGYLRGGVAAESQGVVVRSSDLKNVDDN